MASHFLVGSLTLVVASAMMRSGPGHRSDHAIHACDGVACGVGGSSPNQSSLAYGHVVCQCCWRECEVDSADVQPFQLAGEQEQPKFDTRTASGIDAWLVMCHPKQPLDWNIYTPILETVKVGVESQGAVAQIIGRADMDGMLHGVWAAVAQGRRPLVFAVDLQFAHKGKHDLVTKFMAARQAGAYVVMYQTEPMFNRRATMGRAAHRAFQDARDMGAHEVWDYSLVHTTFYPADDSELIVRYVPPGYVPKLDAGVDVNSNSMDPTRIGFIGKTNKQMHWKYMEMLGDHLSVDNSIFSNEQLRRYLETYPLQLNQHRIQSCCPRNTAWEAGHQHFEAFRMSILLANKACVISAPSSDADMNMWKNVVTFAEVEETVPTMKKLGAKLMECRVQSYETYKREFAPVKLLQRSGFFQAWSPPHGKP